MSDKFKKNRGKNKGIDFNYKWINDVNNIKSTVFNIEEELNNLKNFFYKFKENKNDGHYNLIPLHDLIPLVFIYISLFFILLYGVFKENDWKIYYSSISVMIIVYILFKECLKNEDN